MFKFIVLLASRALVKGRRMSLFWYASRANKMTSIWSCWLSTGSLYRMQLLRRLTGCKNTKFWITFPIANICISCKKIYIHSVCRRFWELRQGLIGLDQRILMGQKKVATAKAWQISHWGYKKECMCNLVAISWSTTIFAALPTQEDPETKLSNGNLVSEMVKR